MNKNIKIKINNLVFYHGNLYPKYTLNCHIIKKMWLLFSHDLSGLNGDEALIQDLSNR